MEKLMSGTKNYFTNSKTSKRLTRKNKKKKFLRLGLASPEADNRLLSNFFMFYHQFNGLGMFTIDFHSQFQEFIFTYIYNKIKPAIAAM